MNSEIDSSVAKAPEEWSFDGLSSFASDFTSSDLVGGVEPALKGPSTPTLKAKGDTKSVSRKERIFENRFSNGNH